VNREAPGRQPWSEPEGRHPAGEHQSEPERDLERRAYDPGSREVPYVDGPTGPAPIASELRGDPGDEGDRQGEGGAMGGAVAGTAVAGPVGGVVGGVIGATIGTAAETGSNDDAGDRSDSADLPSESTVSNTDR
jgi:hypothetical protein